jgi:hypothetical protein
MLELAMLPSESHGILVLVLAAQRNFRLNMELRLVVTTKSCCRNLMTPQTMENLHLSKHPYRVDYHVSCASYFSDGRSISGADFARLWAGTKIYGDYKVTGAFWQEGNVPKSDSMIQLGDIERIQQLLELSDSPIFGGGAYVNSRQVARNVIVDQDFSYLHSQRSRSFGYQTDPYMLYCLSGQWFERVGANVVLKHYFEHFQVADALHAPYGLVDLSSAEDCYGGTIYADSSWVGNIPLHRWVDQIRWLFSRSRQQDRARGVFWGNYFGTAILNRLGGREKFLLRFRQQAQYPDGRPNARVWEFVNGVFVSLCLDPLGCKPGQPLDGSAGQNLHWLVLELGSHGVLNPWTGEQPGQD